jgi:hypothetical protein
MLQTYLYNKQGHALYVSFASNLIAMDNVFTPLLPALEIDKWGF